MDINISPRDIEGCHRLRLGRNSSNTSKRVIVKFVDQKHSQATLQRKKDINSKNKVFVTYWLCTYYRFLWGKFKDLQRKGRISQVFCLGAVVTIRVTENSPAIKILHARDLMVYQERPLPSTHTPPHIIYIRYIIFLASMFYFTAFWLTQNPFSITS